MRLQMAHLRSENSRLMKLLELTQTESRPPGPVQTGMFEAAPGMVHSRSSPEQKLAFYAALFAARRDVHAVRWENARSGRSGWMPAVRGGWRKGLSSSERDYLPLTPTVLTAHLSGESEVGLYPLLDGDRCSWLAADFDGPVAMLDALSYVKAARAVAAPTALEVSRSGAGAHVWLFFTSPIAASLARQIGTGLLREAIALRGRMSLASYDRLFPSQDVLQIGGLGNLIAAPLQGRNPATPETPLLAIATGSYIGEGFDCPALDTLFLTMPIAFKGRLVQYVGRVLRPYPGKTTAEVHDYHDIATGVLASSLPKRAPGYTSLGFPDPRSQIK